MLLWTSRCTASIAKERGRKDVLVMQTTTEEIGKKS